VSVCVCVCVCARVCVCDITQTGGATALLCVSMRTHTDKGKKGNHATNGGRHRLISDMYGQHHDTFLEEEEKEEGGDG
jgi:hypothetical protein